MLGLFLIAEVCTAERIGAGLAASQDRAADEASRPFLTNENSKDYVAVRPVRTDRN